MPPNRPGKGKAAMYVAGQGATTTPESKPTSGAGNTWSGKGSISRRFDKEASSKPPTVRPPPFPTSTPLLTEAQQTPVQSLGGKGDEAAAMAAMFQAQSANWEETQEKMSQWVSSLLVFL